MRRWSAGTLVVLLVVAIAAGPAWAAVGIVRSSIPIKVSPTSPGAGATVTVSFTLPASTLDPGTGSTAVEKHTDSVVINGPQRGGCVSSGSVTAPAARAGATVHVKLRPSSLGDARWCTGHFRGDVTESTTPDCSFKRHMMCPMYEVVPQVIGKFRFTVTAG